VILKQKKEKRSVYHYLHVHACTHSALGNPYSHVTGKTRKNGSKSKVIIFVEARFASRQRGNFDSVNIKFETGTRIQIVNLCTGG
jgi:hypothetical protein